MTTSVSPSRNSGIEPGDRFKKVFPPPGAVIEVERLLDAERAVVRRENGARQVFPVSTLVDPRYWTAT